MYSNLDEKEDYKRNVLSKDEMNRRCPVRFGYKLRCPRILGYKCPVIFGYRFPSDIWLHPGLISDPPPIFMGHG